MHRQWGNRRMGFNSRMNFYRPNQGFPNGNFNRNWMPRYFQPGYRLYNNKNKFGHSFGGGPRRYDRNNVNSDSGMNWMVSPETCFVDPMKRQLRKKDQRSMSRERSVSPHIEGYFKNCRLEEKNYASPYPLQRQSSSLRRNSPHSSKGKLKNGLEREQMNECSPWRSNSPFSPKRVMKSGSEHKQIQELDSRSDDDSNSSPPYNVAKKARIDLDCSDEYDAENKDEDNEVKPKAFNELDKKLKSMIWDEQTNRKGSPFSYTSESIPKYDGKTVVGEEGILIVKLYRCSFCNIVCFDKEKSTQHMLTKYHYNNYKNSLTNFECNNVKEKRSDK